MVDPKDPKGDKDKELEDFGIIMLMDKIDDETVEDVIRFILEANLNKRHDFLNLIINSGGGDCHAGFALIDVMCGSKIPVHTTGLGILASMGLNIFIAGEKGHRILTPNTMIMSHQYFSFNVGKEHELFASRKENDLLSVMLIKHYKKHTSLKEEKEIRKYLLPPHDAWFSAKESKALGLCDVIKEI